MFSVIIFNIHIIINKDLLFHELCFNLTYLRFLLAFIDCELTVFIVIEQDLLFIRSCHKDDLIS